MSYLEKLIQQGIEFQDLVIDKNGKGNMQYRVIANDTIVFASSVHYDCKKFINNFRQFKFKYKY